MCSISSSAKVANFKVLSNEKFKNPFTFPHSQGATLVLSSGIFIIFSKEVIHWKDRVYLPRLDGYSDTGSDVT